MDKTVQILVYFIIYSFLGWVMESILKTVLEKKFVNSGFLHGPVCPIYGFGAIIMILFLNMFRSNILILFIMSFLILSIWEYIVGLLLEKIFHTKYWDYSENKFNIKGRVCLLNSLFWGILGVVFTLYMHPFIEEKIQLIPYNILIIIGIIIYIILIIDTIVSTVKIKTISKTLEKITDIGENIKEKLAEIKEAKNEITEEMKEKIPKDLEKAVERLRRKQIRMKIRLYKNVRRLKEAFPTMKADKITEILNQKIDLKALKEKLRNKEK